MRAGMVGCAPTILELAVLGLDILLPLAAAALYSLWIMLVGISCGLSN